MKAWARFRSLPLWAQIPIGAVVGLTALAIVAAPFTPEEENLSSTGTTRTPASAATSSIPSTPSTTALPSTTASIMATTKPTAPPAALPAGQDTAVTRIVDGDTIDVTGGTRVRLIGIDTPESTSTVECYGREASAKLAQLISVGQRIRLAYDVERHDRYGRTLAYVYRLPDGEFVNLTMAREGFATQLTIPPNVAHAEAFRAAVAEARDANRGLWSACPATSATTRAPATSPPATSTSGGDVYYANCAAARAAGAAPLRRGDPGYRTNLDRDGDGVACE